MTRQARDATPRTGYQQLRHRAVLWEADRRDYGRFDWLPEPPEPTFEPGFTPAHTLDTTKYPMYALACGQGIRIRTDGKPHQPLQKEMADMQAQQGPLVALRMFHPELDNQSTVTAEGRRAIVQGSKTAWYRWLNVHARTCTRFTCHPQRDDYARTHSHGVLPLVALSKPYQRLTTAAKPGPGGGVLLPGNIHAVWMGVTAGDHEGMARYLSRYPNDAALLPRHTPEYLDLAEEIAANMQYSDGERVNLCWRLSPRWRTEK